MPFDTKKTIDTALYGMTHAEAMESGAHGMRWYIRLLPNRRKAFDRMIRSQLSDIQEMIAIGDEPMLEQARQRLNVVKLWIKERDTLTETA